MNNHFNYQVKGRWTTTLVIRYWSYYYCTNTLVLHAPFKAQSFTSKRIHLRYAQTYTRDKTALHMDGHIQQSFVLLLSARFAGSNQADDCGYVSNWRNGRIPCKRLCRSEMASQIIRTGRTVPLIAYNYLRLSGMPPTRVIKPTSREEAG